MADEKPAVAAAALLRADIKILEVKAGPAEEGRVIVEEEREADAFAVVLGEDDLGVAAWSEQALAQALFRRRHFVLELLEPRQVADEAEYVGDVVDARFDDLRLRHRRLSLRLALPAGGSRRRADRL